MAGWTHRFLAGMLFFVPLILLAALDLETRARSRSAELVEPDRCGSSLSPVEPVEPAETSRIDVTDPMATDADYAAHVARLKRRLPTDDFRIVIQKPFVVISDESVESLRRRCKSTIEWAVTRLKQQYFEKDPERIIDIWLFKDRVSYETNVEWLFGRKPHTPFGYYSRSDRALVMNISTGGGTLVHEIVHPFIESNFPDCPAWFNEGLASLYEQCRDRDGLIWGSTNWRLRGLQDAIRRDAVPPFKTLCEASAREFYQEDPGTNYSQARYLCYYLQQHGLLDKFYRRFCDHVDRDPAGYETLKSVLEVEDMDEFQTRWQDYILRLRFPDQE